MASYTLKFSDPNTSSTITVLGADVSPGKNNYDTSLELVGPGYTNFGQAYAQNFVKLLENFASPYPPLNPIKGQLWYDTSNSDRYILRINNGTLTSSRWPSASGIYQQSNDPYVEYPGNIKEGDIWVDTSVNQLKIRYATGWTLVGPSTQAGTNKSGSEATAIQSNTGTTYPVILNWVNGKVVEIVSNNDFTPRTVIEGFSAIRAGTNLTTKNYARYNGLADRAAGLELPNGTVVPSKDILKNRATSQTHTGTFIVEAGNGLIVKSLNNPENLRSYIGLSGGALKAYIDFSNTATNSTLKVGIKDNSYLLFNVNGNAGINTPTPSATFDVNGSGRFLNTLTVTSTAPVALAVGGGATFGGFVSFASGSINGSLTITNTVTLGTAGSGVILNPAIDDQYDIGTTSTRFRNIFAKEIGILGSTRFYGTLTGSASQLAINREFSLSGQLSSTPVEFDGSTDVVMTATLTAQAINEQVSLVTATSTATLLIDDGGLHKITKTDLLQDVYPYINVPGTIVMWGSSTPPSGYLICNGTAYSQATYANLYAAISTNYGAGAPGTFRVPLLTMNDGGGNPVYFIIKT
jgi:hypothetical protein